MDSNSHQRLQRNLQLTDDDTFISIMTSFGHFWHHLAPMNDQLINANKGTIEAKGFIYTIEQIKTGTKAYPISLDVHEHSVYLNSVDIDCVRNDELLLKSLNYTEHGMNITQDLINKAYTRLIDAHNNEVIKVKSSEFGNYEMNKQRKKKEYKLVGEVLCESEELRKQWKQRYVPLPVMLEFVIKTVNGDMCHLGYLLKHRLQNEATKKKVPFAEYLSEFKGKKK